MNLSSSAMSSSVGALTRHWKIGHAFGRDLQTSIPSFSQCGTMMRLSSPYTTDHKLRTCTHIPHHIARLGPDGL